MLRHRVDFRVQLPLYLYHVLLVLLSYQIYGQTDLSKSSTSTNPVQINTGLGREVKVDDHVHSLHVNTSCDQIRTHQSLKLSLRESLKTFRPLISLHIGMQKLILIPLLIQFFGQKLCTFIRATENDALVDYQRTVYLKNRPHLLLLVHQHVEVRQTD